MKIQSGNIVRYKGRIDPDTWVKSDTFRDSKPYGLVLETRTYKTGGDTRYAAHVEIAYVQWFDHKWNTAGSGYAEEMIADLELIA